MFVPFVFSVCVSRVYVDLNCNSDFRIINGSLVGKPSIEDIVDVTNSHAGVLLIRSFVYLCVFIGFIWIFTFCEYCVKLGGFGVFLCA